MKRTSFVCVAAFAVLAFLVFGAGVADANFKGPWGTGSSGRTTTS
jgi:hypothetical protein